MSSRLLPLLLMLVASCARADAERLDDCGGTSCDEMARIRYAEGMNLLAQSPVELAEASRHGAPLDARARTLALAAADLAAAADAFAQAHSHDLRDQMGAAAAADHALLTGQALVLAAQAGPQARAEHAVAFAQALADLGQALEARDDAAAALEVARLAGRRTASYYHRAYTLAARRMIRELQNGRSSEATAQLLALGDEVATHCLNAQPELAGYCMAASRFTGLARTPDQMAEIIDAYHTLTQRSALLTQLEHKGLLAR